MTIEADAVRAALMLEADFLDDLGKHRAADETRERSYKATRVDDATHELRVQLAALRQLQEDLSRTLAALRSDPLDGLDQSDSSTVEPLSFLRLGNRTPSATEIFTVHPREFRDVQVIADKVREGVAVIVNLSRMDDANARRVVDFISGLTQAGLGRIERVTSKTFLISPQTQPVGPDEAKDRVGEFWLNTPDT